MCSRTAVRIFFTLFQDSGGFQLVSLSAFTQITEEGALFESPFTKELTMLTPEESISIQVCYFSV